MRESQSWRRFSVVAKSGLSESGARSGRDFHAKLAKLLCRVCYRRCQRVSCLQLIECLKGSDTYSSGFVVDILSVDSKLENRASQVVEVDEGRNGFLLVFKRSNMRRRGLYHSDLEAFQVPPPPLLLFFKKSIHAIIYFLGF